ncbi:hypothetical protein [Pedobacter sp. L105]|uniref:hypothetical protein n=1 Tax=Pedobacter sp. L105 TaxID=1641871 RepID=UPI00131DF0C3|nr:hypothetical protein [Pedobacter sp. L105]
MKTLEQIRRPSKLEQKVAIKSYPALFSVLSHINTEEAEIENEETKERIKRPKVPMIYLLVITIVYNSFVAILSIATKELFCFPFAN